MGSSGPESRDIPQKARWIWTLPRPHDAVFPCHPQPPGQMPSTDARRGWPLCSLLPHLTAGRSWAGTRILGGRRARRRPLRWNGGRRASRGQVCATTPVTTVTTPITTIHNQDARNTSPEAPEQAATDTLGRSEAPIQVGGGLRLSAPVLAQESRRVSQPQCRNRALAPRTVNQKPETDSVWGPGRADKA